ncbi:hypothetical protein [Mycobacterium szulgai]|uniref:hypothetical protein n=1 Tax=Mycobacterium szulgai TaxID=1787 RepID=UPI0021F33B00|nr:hypothetical protein [Mycobacterium szulgai]MCV7076458.1 hypothetical protein [Mycobacterium szulgai]
MSVDAPVLVAATAAVVGTGGTSVADGGAAGVAGGRGAGSGCAGIDRGGVCGLVEVLEQRQLGLGLSYSTG